MKLKCLSMMGLASAVFPLIGCVSDVPDEGAVSQPALTVNRLAVNGIVSNRLVASSVAENPLAVGRTGSSLTVNPVSDPLLSTTEGREYFSYIVGCAVPAGQVVEAVAGGEALSFQGSVGLAPDWEYRAMSASEKRWVSACLLSRVNAYGISVAISMRGEHAALATVAGETGAFGLVEGAFYGDVFTSTDEKMEMIACRGAAQAAGETGGLVDRDCTELGANGLTKCGFTYAGDCLDFSPQTPSAYACSFAWGGNYRDCHTRPTRALWEPGTSRSEVITTYVTN
jgi:hypothetical protein